VADLTSGIQRTKLVPVNQREPSEIAVLVLMLPAHASQCSLSTLCERTQPQSIDELDRARDRRRVIGVCRRDRQFLMCAYKFAVEAPSNASSKRHASPEVHELGIEQRQPPLIAERLVYAHRIDDEFRLALLQIPVFDCVGGLLRGGLGDGAGDLLDPFGEFAAQCDLVVCGPVPKRKIDVEQRAQNIGA